MKHFTIDELCRSSRAERMGIRNEPNAEERANIESLIDNLLDKVREMYGKPIYVTSGFRCMALNSAIGGVKGSQHQLGQAVDIVTSRMIQDRKGQKELFNLILKSGLEFDQLIWEKGNIVGPDWIHISYNKDKNRRQVLKTDDGKKYYYY